jgi:hypothetical protein
VVMGPDDELMILDSDWKLCRSNDSILRNSKLVHGLTSSRGYWSVEDTCPRVDSKQIVGRLPRGRRNWMFRSES